MAILGTRGVPAKYGGFETLAEELGRRLAEHDVLLGLDAASVDASLGKREDRDNPLGWCKAVGAGRMFYTALGHRPEVWQDPRFLRLVTAGLRWTAEPGGRLHRAPRGATVLFDGGDIGLNSNQKKMRNLTVIEENGRRYYKAYVADRLDGDWIPVADTAERPFAGWKNIRPARGVEPWTDNISHGELIRDGYDQTLTVDPDNLRLVFQGMFDKDKARKGYGQFQWRIGRLTPVPAEPR